MGKSNIVSNSAKIQVILGSKIYEIVKKLISSQKCEKTNRQTYNLTTIQTD